MTISTGCKLIAALGLIWIMLQVAMIRAAGAAIRLELNRTLGAAAEVIR